MKLIQENPFEVCTFTTEEEDALKLTEDSRIRNVWDDRLDALFRSPIFQGGTREVGDPLFWAPLIALFNGPREEEILQLGPDDFSSEGGIHYFAIRNIEGNSVKSLCSERKLPVHPVLIDLGLIQIVELRRAEGQPRLFPYLERGQTKGTFTDIFTKAFGYYRRSNGLDWRGLDFHALRTTFHSWLENRSTPGSIRRKLMGHEPRDEGEKSYSRGLKMSVLLKWTKEIDIDISMIRSPFEESKSSAASARGEALGLRLVAK